LIPVAIRFLAFEERNAGVFDLSPSEKLSYYGFMISGKKRIFTLPEKFCKARGFTLVEMLLVVAVIGIMTSMVIAAITNSSADARRVIARQQQATVQEALNAWIASTNLSGALQKYGEADTASKKMGLISKYLDTNARWMTTGLTYNGSGVQSENMKTINVTMTFGPWNASNYPVVTLQGD
jgi:prepilin-type N-terminal cleavage/methylation domain-containing protein